MTQPTSFASGLQPERTALAWRRTTLSLLLGSVVSFRLLSPAIGAWSALVGCIGLLVTGIVWVLAGRRQRRAVAAVDGSAELPGGGLLFFLCVSTALAAAVGVIYVVRSI